MTGRGPIRQSLTVMIWGAVATSAIAQSSSFDMSPERPAQTRAKARGAARHFSGGTAS